MKLVSSRWMSTRMKDISLRVFSKITLGSSDWQRRQLGAITMARLFTSILEADEVAEHQLVDVRQAKHHGDSGLRVVVNSWGISGSSSSLYQSFSRDAGDRRAHRQHESIQVIPLLFMERAFPDQRTLIREKWLMEILLPTCFYRVKKNPVFLRPGTEPSGSQTELLFPLRLSRGHLDIVQHKYRRTPSPLTDQRTPIAYRNWLTDKGLTRTLFSLTVYRGRRISFLSRRRNVFTPGPGEGISSSALKGLVSQRTSTQFWLSQKLLL
ncbi:hypothetical protein EYF80_012313 [Liparis tanakae]|uniref:Uncharacterized protein n=1 Tax=Liparis tanakae TaxID=230148 RepID=A0A4Z2IHK6_9TELE|nr:hypothetical protein EYF80_012313 [Liparis tanakae]